MINVLEATLAERFAHRITDLSDQERVFKEILHDYSDHFNIPITFVACFSYYRQPTLVEERGKYIFLWDRALLALQSSIVQLIELDDVSRSRSRLFCLLEFYLLENAIRLGLDQRYPLFLSHLDHAGPLFASSYKFEINNSTLAQADRYVLHFCFFHELGHLQLLHDPKTRKIMAESLAEILNILKDEAIFGGTDMTYKEYHDRLVSALARPNTKEEILCDIFATKCLIQLLDVSAKNFAIAYFATLLQYKISCSLSNMRGKLDGNKRAKSSHNYHEQRIRIDFRGYACTVYIQRKHPELYTQFQTLKKSLTDPLMGRYEDIYPHVEHALMDDDYEDALIDKVLHETERVPQTNEGMLRAVGWIK